MLTYWVGDEFKLTPSPSPDDNFTTEPYIYTDSTRYIPGPNAKMFVLDEPVDVGVIQHVDLETGISWRTVIDRDNNYWVERMEGHRIDRWLTTTEGVTMIEPAMYFDGVEVSAAHVLLNDEPVLRLSRGRWTGNIDVHTKKVLTSLCTIYDHHGIVPIIPWSTS